MDQRRAHPDRGVVMIAVFIVVIGALLVADKCAREHDRWKR